MKNYLLWLQICFRRTFLFILFGQAKSQKAWKFVSDEHHSFQTILLPYIIVRKATPIRFCNADRQKRKIMTGLALAIILIG